MQVSARFRREIELHLIRNLVRYPLAGTPLLLAIHGAPGTGKSFQLDQILMDLNVTVVPISSADLESDRANDPAKLIRRSYLDLAEKMQMEGIPACAIVINDLDAGLGDWGELVQTTVNRQLVLGELMHLSDRPDAVEGSPNQRVPIFITANDLSKIYAPVTRAGRMKKFHWAPTASELMHILQSVYKDLPQSDVASILERFPDRPITFFVDALNAAIDESIGHLLETADTKSLLLAARRGQLQPAFQLNYDSVLQAAEHIERQDSAVQDYSEQNVHNGRHRTIEGTE